VTAPMSEAHPSQRELQQALANPKLRSKLISALRSKVPQGDLEDVVQATLADALASSHAPPNAEDIQRWVFGIARHKVADYYRKRHREQPGDLPEQPQHDTPELQARDLLRWADGELPGTQTSQETLNWLLREGEGETLEEIAKEQQIPAPTVRQRVVRLRKHFKQRWALELTAAALIAVLAGVYWWVTREKEIQEKGIVQDVPSINSATPSPYERATEIRKLALKDCEAQRFQECVKRLDEAQILDPTGENAPDIQKARKQAAEALTPKPGPTTSSSDTPTKLATPPSPSGSAARPPNPTIPITAKPPFPSKVPPATTFGKRPSPKPSPDSFSYQPKSAPSKSGKKRFSSEFDIGLGSKGSFGGTGRKLR
jgi:DNA-directed RNA polymerase specialized sigma24 family protein